jgi:hypothetical protein
MATLTVRDIPSEVEDMISAACHRLNGRGVRELLMLRTVNKAFRRNVDQFVITITLTIINGGFGFARGLIAQDKKANLMQLMEIVVNWIALGCVSFVRVAEMRGESKSKVHVRSFMYTMAYNFTCPWGFERDVFSSMAFERDVFSSMATSRLAPGGQGLFPGVSEEEIRKTLTLAVKGRLTG